MADLLVKATGSWLLWTWKCSKQCASEFIHCRANWGVNIPPSAPAHHLVLTLWLPWCVCHVKELRRQRFLKYNLFTHTPKPCLSLHKPIPGLPTRSTVVIPCVMDMCRAVAYNLKCSMVHICVHKLRRPHLNQPFFYNFYFKSIR